MGSRKHGQETSFIEKRRHVRRRFETYVSAFTGTTLLFSNALDISEGGILLRTEVELSAGDSLELRFFLPSGEFVPARGRVVRCRSVQPGEFQAGIEFLTVPPQAQIALGAYVAET